MNFKSLFCLVSFALFSLISTERGYGQQAQQPSQHPPSAFQAPTAAHRIEEKKAGSYVVSRETFLGKLRDGPYELFDPKTGTLVERGNYKGGKKDGIIEIFTGGGRLKKKEQYLDGKLHGQVEEFDSNGKIANSATFQNGKKAGLETKYLNGIRVGDITYNSDGSGKQILQRNYHPGGQQVSLYLERNGSKKHGKEITYDVHGVEIKTCQYQNDVLVTECTNHKAPGQQ